MTDSDNLAIFKQVQEELRQERARIELLAELQIETLVGAAIAAMVKPELDWAGKARQPVSEETVGEAESTIGVPIPMEIMKFYLHCNGIEALSEGFPYPVVPVDELRVGHQCEPALSEWVRRRAVESGTSEQFTGAAVFAHDDPDALATGTSIFRLRSQALDQLVVLENSTDFRRICFVPFAIGEYLPGAILEIENSVAVIYDSFRVWLASLIINYR